MHIITMCPLCNEDFMYHQTDVNLKRNITFVDEVGNNEVEETIICQDCDSKEKPKQGTISEAIKQVINVKLNEKIKQETLEEVAEKLYLSYENNEFLYGHSEDLQLAYKAGVVDGAKWQQERSYSEEEVLEIIRQYTLEEHLITSSKPDIWFEQFKNK